MKTKGIQRRTKSSVVATLLTVLALFGCSDTQRLEATGKSAVRGINALVDSPEISFLIEERSIGGVSFKGVAGFAEYDDLTYNFNFDILLTGDTEATRLGSQFIDVVVDHEYTVVLSGRFVFQRTAITTVHLMEGYMKMLDVRFIPMTGFGIHIVHIIQLMC